MKKTFLSILLSLFFQLGISQDTLFNSRFEKFIIQDSSFIFNEEIVKKFGNNHENMMLSLDLVDRIKQLPFNHCKFFHMTYALYVDTLGKVAFFDLLTPTSNVKMDGLIKNEIEKTSGLWIPAKSNDTLRKIIYLTGYIDNGKSHRKIYNYYMQDYFHREIENCDNADFYYNNGVKYFQDKNYKRAIYFFKLANESNPFDLDVLYNLAMSYLKVEKRKEACDCIETLFELGDKESNAMLEKYCGIKK
ncbi:MAG: tetratricopeptide repeat protein [Bacteroidia bacterium]